MSTVTETRRAARYEALRASGKTIEQVAREAGLSPATVRAYLRSPSTHRRRALRLAKALGCSMELLRR